MKLIRKRYTPEWFDRPERVVSNFKDILEYSRIRKRAIRAIKSTSQKYLTLQFRATKNSENLYMKTIERLQKKHDKINYLKEA